MAHHVNEKDTTLIALFVAMREHGPVCEQVPARDLGEGRYELLSSPGLALNLARGDIVSIGDPAAPATVLQRGGNFCIQIYADELSPPDVAELEEEVGQQLGGTLDGIHDGNLALTVPAAAGMAHIVRVFDAYTARTGIAWYFANIYRNFEDVDDETLLDWWQ